MVFIIHIIGRIQDGSNITNYFRNPSRKRRQAQNEPTPLSFNDLNITEEHRALCGDNAACLFDVAATGDLELGEINLEVQTEANETVDAASEHSVCMHVLYILMHDFTQSLTLLLQ